MTTFSGLAALRTITAGDIVPIGSLKVTRTSVHSAPKTGEVRIGAGQAHHRITLTEKRSLITSEEMDGKGDPNITATRKKTVAFAGSVPVSVTIMINWICNS
jgi:hypothetical protein